MHTYLPPLPLQWLNCSPSRAPPSLSLFRDAMPTTVHPLLCGLYFLFTIQFLSAHTHLCKLFTLKTANKNPLFTTHPCLATTLFISLSFVQNSLKAVYSCHLPFCPSCRLLNPLKLGLYLRHALKGVLSRSPMGSTWLNRIQVNSQFSFYMVYKWPQGSLPP